MARYSVFSLVRNALTYHENWQRAWRSPDPKPEYEMQVIASVGHGAEPSSARSGGGNWKAGGPKGPEPNVVPPRSQYPCCYCLRIAAARVRPPWRALGSGRMRQRTFGGRVLVVDNCLEAAIAADFADQGFGAFWVGHASRPIQFARNPHRSKEHGNEFHLNLLSWLPGWTTWLISKHSLKQQFLLPLTLFWVSLPAAWAITNGNAMENCVTRVPRTPSGIRLVRGRRQITIFRRGQA